MPSQTIDVHDLPDRFAEAVRLAAAGTEVILTDGAVPYARLVALATTRQRVAGLHAGAMETTEDFDAPLPDTFWTGTA